jgi:hypothetical protein
MSRLFVILGILMIIAGFIVPFIGGFAAFSGDNFANVLDVATNTEAAAAQFCREGETLVTEEGAAEFNPQTNISGRTVLYYCEDSDGDRRDVTGEVVETLIGDTVGGLMSILPGFLGSGLLGCILSPLGIVFLIIGIFLGVRQRRVEVPAGFGSPGSPVESFGSGGSPRVVMTTREGSPSSFANLMKEMKAKEGGDLAGRLQQLEEARAKNLISQEEYDRLRKDILSGLG